MQLLAQPKAAENAYANCYHKIAVIWLLKKLYSFQDFRLSFFVLDAWRVRFFCFAEGPAEELPKL